MAAPLASVFTPSHNKGCYAVDAIRSVLAQDCTDFEYWILENSTDGGETRDMIRPLLGDPRIIYEEIDLTPEERASCYVPAMILNRYYPKANGKYIFYNSDDDLLEPGCLNRCVAFLDADPSRYVCYFTQRLLAYQAGDWAVAGQRAAAAPIGYGTQQPIVDCRIDGGQIAHRKDALDHIDWPWFPEEPEPVLACHADGRFMQKLAEQFTFHPAGGEVLGIKRRTPLSVWDHS